MTELLELGAFTLDGDAVREAGSVFIDAISAFVMVLTPDGRVARINRALSELLGLAEHEVVGASVAQLMHERDAASVRKAIASLDPSDLPRRRDRTHVDAHGSECVIEWTTQTVLDDRGRLQYLVSTGIDVTGRRRAERAVTEGRALMEKFLDNVPALVTWKDVDGRYVHVNSGIEDISGRSREEVLGCRPDEVFASPEAAGIAAADRQALASDEPLRSRHTLFHHDAAHHYLSIRFALRDAAGAPTGIGAISVDITDQMLAEEQLKLSYQEMLARLARAVEFRDHETAGHVERMTMYCGLIASKLGFDADRCDLIRQASTLHDAGKIAIPDEILRKPGPLTAEERTVIETHPAVGRDLLSGSASPLLELAATIAHTHHERYDGTGYPLGLAGAAIPIEGRIAAVADVFDALTSDRVYRPAMTQDEATGLMRASRGTHFDPVILDAFLEVLDAQARGDAELPA